MFKCLNFVMCMYVPSAIKTQSNFRLVQKLLDSMQMALERGHYEHVGSQQLWRAHGVTVDRLQSRLEALDLAEVCSVFSILSCYNQGYDGIYLYAKPYEPSQVHNCNHDMLTFCNIQGYCGHWITVPISIPMGIPIPMAAPVTSHINPIFYTPPNQFSRCASGCNHSSSQLCSSVRYYLQSRITFAFPDQ